FNEKAADSAPVGGRTGIRAVRAGRSKNEQRRYEAAQRQIATGRDPQGRASEDSRGRVGAGQAGRAAPGRPDQGRPPRALDRHTEEDRRYREAGAKNSYPAQEVICDWLRSS